MYINCGQSALIHVVEANYGRLDNAMCAVPVLGTPNDDCRFDAACVVTKWLDFYHRNYTLWYFNRRGVARLFMNTFIRPKTETDRQADRYIQMKT